MRPSTWTLRRPAVVIGAVSWLGSVGCAATPNAADPGAGMSTTPAQSSTHAGLAGAQSVARTPSAAAVQASAGSSGPAAVSGSGAPDTATRGQPRGAIGGASGASGESGSAGERGVMGAADGGDASPAGSGATPAGASTGTASAGSSAGAASAGAATAPATTGTGFRCPAGPFDALVLEGLSPVRVEGLPPADAFNDSGNTRTNLEGPVWIGDKLYVSEFPFLPAPESRILAFDPGAHTVTVALASSGSNGLAVDSHGNLIATDHRQGAVVRMQFPLGSDEVLVGSYDGARFNSPNDLAMRSDGTLYFSDPDYQAPSQHPQPKTRVYQLSPGAAEATVVDETRSQPNGVTLSADERTLYVSGADGIFRYPVPEDGHVAAGSGIRIDAFGGGSDGLGMDCAGNLYATSGQRIVVLSPQAESLGEIAVPQAESVTNVAFGGPQHKTLFITSMGSGDQRGVFQVELAIPGLPY